MLLSMLRGQYTCIYSCDRLYMYMYVYEDEVKLISVHV